MFKKISKSTTTTDPTLAGAERKHRETQEIIARDEARESQLNEQISGLETTIADTAAADLIAGDRSNKRLGAMRARLDSLRSELAETKDRLRRNRELLPALERLVQNEQRNAVERAALFEDYQREIRSLIEAYDGVVAANDRTRRAFESAHDAGCHNLHPCWLNLNMAGDPRREAAVFDYVV